MNLTELIAAFPNLAFGLLAFWFYQQVQKERVTENTRYADSLEKVNELYIQLLERAVIAIANNATQSAENGDSLEKLRADIAACRAELGGVRDAVNGFTRGRTDRNAADR